MDFLTILQPFDDFSTNLPSPSTSLYLTALWVVLVDKSVNELVLSIEVSGARRDVDRGRKNI